MTVASLDQEFVAEYPDRRAAAQAREALEAHGVDARHLSLAAAPPAAGGTREAALRFDRQTMRRIGGFTFAGIVIGGVGGVVMVALGVAVAAAVGVHIGTVAAIAVLLGGTGGVEAGAFIGATASLPAFAEINDDTASQAEPHVFVRVTPADGREAELAIEAFAETHPEHLRRLSGPALRPAA
ncbi:MAG: hypothetical protein ACYDEB_13445 [Dehalococcoidia bacterium]